MLIAALVTVVMKRSQPACPSTDEWIAKVWVVYVCMLLCAFNKILFSFKEKCSHKICMKMDGYRTYNIKQGHTISKKKNCMFSLMFGTYPVYM